MDRGIASTVHNIMMSYESCAILEGNTVYFNWEGGGRMRSGLDGGAGPLNE